MPDEVAALEPLIDVDPVEPAAKPAPGAEEQKPRPPADDAEVVPETTEQQEAKKQSKFQRRLDRQKSARVAAETEAKLLREQIARLEAQPKQPQDTGEPQREAFADYETYLRAVTRYDAKQEASAALKTEREASQVRDRQQQDNVSQEKIAQQWTEREKAFQATTKDYEDVVTPYVSDEEGLGRLSDGARRLIVDSEVGPHLLHHLASNSDVADRIADLSPLRQLVELGKLEDVVKAPAKRVSNAPDPIKPVGQGRSAANGFSENMSDAQYKEWRKGHGAKWAR